MKLQKHLSVLIGGVAVLLALGGIGCSAHVDEATPLSADLRGGDAGQSTHGKSDDAHGHKGDHGHNGHNDQDGAVDEIDNDQDADVDEDVDESSDEASDVDGGRPQSGHGNGNGKGHSAHP